MNYENLTPQYRIEEYLEAIVSGWVDATEVAYPEVPSWRIEEFLDAFITYIWEDGDHPRHPCPEPAWHIEECLRAIYDVMTGAATPWAFPTPTNRIEEYLAAIHAYLADNTELPVPEPVWRIEQWLAYVLDAVKQGGGVEKTVSGAMVHITDALAKAALGVLVNITPIQSGSGDPSPENIRPISGRTGLSVYSTGKNLFDLDSLETVTVNTGERFGHKYSGVGTYAIKAYATGAAGYVYARVLNTDGTWGSVYYVVANTTATEQTVTISAGQTLFIYNANAWTESASSDLFNGWKVQVVLSSTQPDSYEPYNGNTYAVDWTTQAGMVYGGTLDVVTGLLTVDTAIVTITGGTTVSSSKTSRYKIGDLNTVVPSGDTDKSICNVLKKHTGAPSTIQADSFTIVNSESGNGDYVNIRFSGADSATTANERKILTNQILEQLNNDGTPLQLVYELATPLTYQLTPQEVQMLLGENYVWSSSGDTVSVTYYAEGNANTLQSLNILLGGNYSNPKTADDVSDKEALEIILGGNK